MGHGGHERTMEKVRINKFECERILLLVGKFQCRACASSSTKFFVQYFDPMVDWQRCTASHVREAAYIGGGDLGRAT